MKTSILISSCDAFSDCWEPMIYSFRKSWPDCPYPIYIISNYKEITDDRVSFLKVGKDKAFASNLKRALDQIDSDYIIYFQDDYFIENKVDTASIERHVEHCHDKGIDFLKITDDMMFRDKLRIGDSDYCKNPIDVKYSLNTAIAIWKKECLKTLCLEGFTGWDFERKIIPFIQRNGLSIYSEVIHSSCYPQKGIRSVKGTAIRKGKWTHDGVRYLMENGFRELVGKRKIESNLLTNLLACWKPGSIFRFPVAAIVKVLQKANV